MEKMQTNIRVAAAAGALALAGLGLASPGFAHDEGKAVKDRKVEKVIVISDHRDGPGDGDARAPRVRRMELADCRGGDRTVRESRDGDRTRIVICRRDGRAGPVADGDRRIRAFALNDMRMIDCDRDGTVRESSGDGQRTRVVICTRGDGSPDPATQAQRLEQVLGRINASEDLSADQKARVTAALREAIEQLRPAN